MRINPAAENKGDRPFGAHMKQKLGFLFRVLATLALIGLVVRKLNWPSVAAILSRADWHILATASALTCIPVILLSVRWQLFIRQQGISASNKNVFFLTWAGQFFNTVLPGSTGGDFVKMFHLCQIAPDQKSGAIASVVVDRLAALAALLVLAAGSLFRQPIPRLPEGWQLPTWLISGAAVLALIILLFAFFLSRRMSAYARFSSFIEAMKVGVKPNIALAAGLALAFAIHLFSFFLFFLFSHALGFHITYSQTLVILPVLLALMLVPITVNGHGLREVVLIYYFQALDILPASGTLASAVEFVVSLSILLVANELLWSIPGGFFYMVRFRGIR